MPISNSAIASFTHLGIMEGTSLGLSVGSGVQGVLAKHAKFSGHTTIIMKMMRLMNIGRFHNLNP
jgi:hypothetical protein